MTHKFYEFLWQEVFVVGPDEDVAWPQEIEICKTFEDLIDHMRGLSTSADTDVRILNGYLTPADTLPSSLRGKRAYIIVTDKGTVNLGSISEADNPTDTADLASEIEIIVNDGIDLVASTDIDNIFILYGYEVDVVLAPDDEGIDEEVLETCRHISKEVEDIKTRNFYPGES